MFIHIFNRLKSNKKFSVAFLLLRLLLIQTLLGLIRPSSTTTTTSTTQKTDVEEKISTISQFAEREKLRNEGKENLKKKKKMSNLLE